MKRIVNEKLYDTETATFMVSYPTPYWETTVYESLYRKANGEYFLVDKTSTILPLTTIQAKKWAERICVNDYERIFGIASE